MRFVSQVDIMRYDLATDSSLVVVVREDLGFN